jgi:PAS domain S-box-containing protein
MIYLNRTAQSRLIELLHFALNPNSYLFLGTSESIDGSSDLFTTADKEHHIFCSRPVEARIPLPIPRVSVPQPSSRIDGAPLPVERFSYLDLHLRLLEEYGPPSVIVSEEYNVLHLSESAGRYMQIKGGEPSNNLLKLVRPDIRLELRTALYQATQDRKTYAARGLTMNIDNKPEFVDIIVRPILRDDDGARGLILVVFEQVENQSVSDKAETLISADEPIARQMEEQLIRVKSQLRAASEQSELQTEELKASNEELQAMNEELRSSTEELETNKEELQSLNEELTTVNQELKIKIEELTQSNNDIQNFINSTDIGTIFLDSQMRVKLFTPRSQDIFNLIPTDVGRELSHITNKLGDDRLIQDIQDVVINLQPIQREVKTQDGRWYLLRVVPYRTSEQRADGVILAFVEITERLLAEARDRDSQIYFNMIKEVADFAIIFMDGDGIIQNWNIGAESMFGYTSEEVVGQSGAIIFTPEDRVNGAFEGEMRRALKAGSARDERWHIRKDGSLFFVSGVLSRVGEGSEIGYVKIARNLTQQKNAEDRLHEAREKLETSVKERTRELENANEALRLEISERIQTERIRIRLLRQIVRAQEDERRRIARDIHDELGQQTTALRLKLEAVKEMCRGQQELCDQIDQTQLLAQDLDRGVDFLAWELRPAALDDLGLKAALSNYVSEWSKYSGVNAEFHASGIDKERLSSETETNLYRITQEALNNTMKHAGASRANVLLERRNNHIVLIVEDDGVGFDLQKQKFGRDHRLGLSGMRERTSLIGGSLEIESKPNEGTTIFARVPVIFIEEE